MSGPLLRQLSPRLRDRRRRVDLADVVLHAHSIKLQPDHVQAWFRNIGKD